jgi:small subunit ribosomal protein S1
MVRRHDDEVDLKDEATEETEVEAKPRKRKPTTRLVHEDVGEEANGTGAALKDLDSDEDASSSMGQWLQLYEDSLKDLEEGEIVRGRVLKIDDKEVTVDVGFKSEGVIPVEEFPDLEGVKVGDEIEVFLEKTENQDGLVVLSKQRADFVKVWDRVKTAADNGELVEGKLVRKIKGGVVVDLYGVEAFLPGSQIALRQVQNVDSLIGQLMEFKIIKLNKRRRNIVVSRRSVLEEHRAKQKSEIIQELAKDQIREGVVKNITDFGAFVDLGGIDGLLHITDMSWGRVSHPSELVSIGDKVRVKVLSFDPEKERISLGMKQLTPYPWEDVDKRYQVGQRMKGKVVSITDYGAFVELEKGIEGLIHISEMSWTRHVRHPSKVVAIGDQIEAMILKIDKENEKISLGLKQIEPDPWLSLDERFPIGTRLTGKVRNLTNFGAFVEIEEGIDGLVHISDMSWTRRVVHPSEVLKKGDKVDVVVLSIDKDARRISLGLKQVSEDPWPTLAERYLPDMIVKGKVVRLLDRGVIVDLEDGLEGFIPLSQLGIDGLKKPLDSFKPDDALELKVTRVDTQAHRIILSVKAWLTDQPVAAQAAFQERFKPQPSAAEEPAVSAEEGSDAGTVA